jgi:hypothetical protein
MPVELRLAQSQGRLALALALDRGQVEGGPEHGLGGPGLGQDLAARVATSDRPQKPLPARLAPTANTWLSWARARVRRVSRCS